MTRRTWIAGLVATLVLAALLRFAALDRVPPGLHFDEAVNLFDIQDIRHGVHSIFFARNTGREPLFIYWQALVTSFLRRDAFSLRLAAAIVGWLAVPATAWCALTLGSFDRRPQAKRDTLLAALALAGLYWHVHFSRFGLRTISLALLAPITFGLLWWAARENRRPLWLLAGISGGLTLYTYTSSRIVPLMALAALLLLLRARARLWPGAAMMILAWGLTFAPLGWYFARHTDDFVKRSADVSIFNPVINGGDPAGALWNGLSRTVGMFLVAGSSLGQENLPGRPLLDPLVGGMFAVGLVAAARHARRPAEAFLLCWLALGILPSVLSVNPPGYFRISAAVPAVAIVAGRGAGLICDAAARVRLAGLNRLAMPLVGGALLAGAGLTAWDYFARWAPSDDAYAAMMADKVDVSRHLVTWSQRERVFLAPLYAADSTIQFLTRDARPDTFDMGAGAVIPARSEQPARYVFPIFDTELPARLLESLPPSAVEEISSDPSGRRRLLRSLVVAGRELPPAPERVLARLGDAVALVEGAVPASARPGGRLSVGLTWLATGKPSADYTIFVHVRDAGDQTRSQYDGRPLKGLFPTPRWQPGDRIVERFEISLPPDLPPGRYRLVAGLYELATLQRLAVRTADGRDSGNEVPLGAFTVERP